MSGFSGKDILYSRHDGVIFEWRNNFYPQHMSLFAGAVKVRVFDMCFTKPLNFFLTIRAITWSYRIRYRFWHTFVGKHKYLFWMSRKLACGWKVTIIIIPNQQHYNHSHASQTLITVLSNDKHIKFDIAEISYRNIAVAMVYRHACCALLLILEEFSFKQVLSRLTRPP